MIVITSLNREQRHLLPGDRFNLEVSDATGGKVLISETITEAKVIDFIASFRFALEDGRCPGFHLTGIFANSNELPQEIANAKMLADLTPEQLQNFLATIGTTVNGARA